MKNRPYTVADAILDVLKAHHVTHLFGYPGGAILPFYDALPYHPEIKHILVRNEQGAAFMAGGWARSTKEIGVCCSTSGPGATNLVTGIFDAMMDSVPTLFITGQIPLPMIGKDSFQEADIVGITLNITKHNYLVEKAEDIVYIITEAIAIALSSRPGPVHVDVPKDIMATEHPRDFKIPKIDLSSCDPMAKGHKSQDLRTIQEVVDALNQAKQPILLAGQGVKHAKAEKSLNTLIEKLGIPAVNTILAKGVLPAGNPNHLGFLGMHGFYHSNLAMHEADLILNIGSRFDDRIVGRYDAFGKNAKIIHVDIDKSELGKVVRTDIPIHSDALKFIDQLLVHPELKSLNVTPWKNKISAWRENDPYEKVTPQFSIRNSLHHLFKATNLNLDSYIFVTDVGQHQMWSALSLDCHSSQDWLTSGGSGTMGFGLPAAIGASFANPGKKVICITGDGGMQMNIQELSVLMDHPIDVLVLIVNNSFLGMVRQWQEMFYEHNYSSVDISSPDYKKIAEAYQIPYHRAEKDEDLEGLIPKILKTSGPAILECRVEKEDNVLPMVPGGKHLGDTITSTD